MKYPIGIQSFRKIREPEDYLYTLDYPNRKVRFSLKQVLLATYLSKPSESPLPRIVRMRRALQQKDVAAVIDMLNAAFAEIPYNSNVG